MDALDPVVLPLNCQTCGGPVDVACETHGDGHPERIRFACPYCATPREFQAPGHVLWVAMRQHRGGPETRH